MKEGKKFYIVFRSSVFTLTLKNPIFSALNTKNIYIHYMQ